MHRVLTSLLWLPSLWLLSADVGASTAKADIDSRTPIEITMAGPDAVRIRVAEGTTFPCDSGNNRPLVEGKFAPGQVVRLSSADHCVCLQQTYAPFPDVDWAAAGLVCRPQVCKFAGRKQCVPAPDPSIRVSIWSTRPG